MTEVTVHEIFNVSVQIDGSYPDDRRVRPRTVWFDPNGNYEPGNCRWADAVTQRRNQTRYRAGRS